MHAILSVLCMLEIKRFLIASLDGVLSGGNICRFFFFYEEILKILAMKDDDQCLWMYF